MRRDERLQPHSFRMKRLHIFSRFPALQFAEKFQEVKEAAKLAKDKSQDKAETSSNHSQVSRASDWLPRPHRVRLIGRLQPHSAEAPTDAKVLVCSPLKSLCASNCTVRVKVFTESTVGA